MKKSFSLVIILTSLTTLCGYAQTLNTLAKFTGSGTTVTNSNVFDNGSVGIGTTAPEKTLHVNGSFLITTGGFTGLDARSTRTNPTDNIGGLRFFNSSNVEVGGFHGTVQGDLRFETATAGNYSMVILGANGNVGLGTMTPLAKFESVSGVNAFPATSGISSSGIAARFRGGDNAILDFGVNTSSGAWIQSRDQSTYALNYPLLLNPNNGNVGIGTTSPATKLDVKGAIGLNGIAVDDAITIPTTTDGTYVIASGPRVKGTYTLSFEGSSRVQTAVLLVDACQFNGNTLSILSNNPYGGIDVIKNFRIYKSATAETVYLVCDVSDRSGGTQMRVHFNGNDYYNANWGGTLPANASLQGSITLGVKQDRLGIGTDNPTEKLSVNGTIRSKEVKVEATPWPDFVFKPAYQLHPLTEVQTYIDKYQHLPDVPSAAEVEKEGLSLGKMNAVLLKKVEELTLYLLKQQQQLQEQQKQIDQLKNNAKQ